MIGFVLFWSHALAAILYGALAVWQLRNWSNAKRNRPLVLAFAVTSAWAIFVATLGPHSAAAGIAEAGRNFAFLAYMYALVRSADEAPQTAVKAVYVTIAGAIGLQLTVAGVIPDFAAKPLVYQALLSSGQILGLTIAAGSLVLVHNLYGQAAPDARWGIRLPMVALAGMWIYDLHSYTVGYLTRTPASDLFAMRGAVLAMLVPLFALASRRNGQWRMQVSRAATFQSVSVLVILGYLIVMMSATRAMEIVGGDWVRLGQIGFMFGITIAAAVLLPSGRMRGWLRVIVAKHFFEHRFDYRQEWLRFTRTIGVAGEDRPPIAERVVKALADLGECPGGLLLLREENGRFLAAAQWNWDPNCTAGSGEDAAFIRFLEGSGHVVDFGTVRGGEIRIKGEHVPVPAWLAAIEGAWAGVPLLHQDRLVGLVILTHPPDRRPLDWEDFDLFRTAGIQAASYLAEARSQEALANAQRFDDFNRRFAFIMHDIKNLVSQLSLVARNAERHAHNPEFREDMIATLQASVRKMNDLLARLNNGSNVDAEPPRQIELRRVVDAVASVKRRVHPVETSGDEGLCAHADPGRLEQVLAHLVQNAIDASPHGVPVHVSYEERGGEAVAEVADRGCGMSPEFIRTRLFQPFASTKEGGFGVGAFEARSLVAAMGGRIEVDSEEGSGSRFTVFLPLAERKAAQPERMRA
ncbi:MAG: PEP-CTERM system histidine kinase PrsK [Alphaproteobacteria bacterium]|nr:MAG: PEP-CTERM system histidine kinase PrsK [Alphaproteobacteria bacterium]